MSPTLGMTLKMMSFGDETIDIQPCVSLLPPSLSASGPFCKLNLLKYTCIKNNVNLNKLAILYQKHHLVKLFYKKTDMLIDRFVFRLESAPRRGKN